MKESIGDRISKIIDKENLKKVEFAKSVNIDQSYVTRLIKGKGSPSDRLIKDICVKFSISEKWLRSGEGDMEMELSRDESIAAWAGKILRDDPRNDFIRQFVEILIKLDTDDWKTLEKIANMLVVAKKKD